MYLYFQFLTQNQKVEAVEIVKALSVFTDGQAIRGQAKVHASASVSRRSFSDLDELATKMEKVRFNALTLMPEVEWMETGTVRARVSECKAIFTPSVTSSLWLPSKEWRTDGGRSSDNQYMTAKSEEEALAYHKVKRSPSVFEVLLKIRTSISQKEVLAACAKKLAKAMPRSLDGIRPFGCGDVLKPIYIPQLKRSVVVPMNYQVLMELKPRGYPELGERIEALHPLMFGSKRVCKGLKQSLGGDASLILAGHLKDFGVVRLAERCDFVSAKERASKWLISGADKIAGQ